MNITELLAFSVQHRASDLHLSAGSAPFIRVDGEIRRLNVPAQSQQEVSTLLQQVMSEQQFSVFQQQAEADLAFDKAGLGRFRVNVFKQQRGIAAVFRLIPAAIPSLEALHAPEILRRVADSPRGLVLVTGPTGSGKSTTLAAMLDYINSQRHKHILTIEDPVEFLHQNKLSLISQRQLHTDTHSFSQALRAALREDPDVIMVGELRDAETIRLALTAAETGHLVLASLHTASAARTVDRITDIFAPEEKLLVRTMLAESLYAVVSQALLQRIGGGRIAAYEVMLATPAVRNLIREDKTAQLVSVMQTGMTQGMQTLDQALQQLVKTGQITQQQAAEQAQDRRLFIQERL